MKSYKTNLEQVQENSREHLQLIEQLSKQINKQQEVVEENRKVISQQVGEFEKNVLNELKNATKLFNFKAYEQSFSKLEDSYKDTYAQLMKLQNEQAYSKEDLAQWKTNVIDQVKKIAVKVDYQGDTQNKET